MLAHVRGVPEGGSSERSLPWISGERASSRRAQIRVIDVVSVLTLHLVLIFFFFFFCVRGEGEGERQTGTGNNHKLCASQELDLSEGCASLLIFAQKVSEYVLTGLSEHLPVVEHFCALFVEGFCVLAPRDEAPYVAWGKSED